MNAQDKQAILEKIEELERLIENRERWLRQDRLTVEALRAQLDTEKGESQ